MRIVVPYTREYLSEETRAAVPTGSGFYEMVEETSYAHLIRTLASEGEDVILVEHDIVPTAEQLAELRDCPHPWCAFRYEPFWCDDYNGDPPKLVPDFYVVGLGLTKLGAPVLEKLRNPPFPQVRWDHVDYIVTAFSRQNGFRVHQHDGDVRHLMARHGK